MFCIFKVYGGYVVNATNHVLLYFSGLFQYHVKERYFIKEDVFSVFLSLFQDNKDVNTKVTNKFDLQQFADKPFKPYFEYVLYLNTAKPKKLMILTGRYIFSCIVYGNH